MTSILKVTKIQDPTNGNDALTIGTDGLVTASSQGIIIPGSVIQHKHSLLRHGSSNTTTATYAEVSADYRVTITPRQADSYMLLNFTAGFAVGGATRMGVKPYVSTDNFVTNNAIRTGSYNESMRNDTGSYIIQRGNITETYDAYSTTDTLYFTMFFARPLGSSTARVNDNTGYGMLSVYEIAT